MKADDRSPTPHDSQKVLGIPGSRRRGECILPFHDPNARLPREITVPHFEQWEGWGADPVAKYLIDGGAGA